MCRNIRMLYNIEPPATDEEVRAAARQYVRKVSGYASPSNANRDAFDRAVADIAAATSTLLSALVTHAPSRDRAELAAKAHERASLRFASTEPESRKPDRRDMT